MNLSDQLTATVADELAQCGVTEAVISPGLHSGLLASALYRHPGLRLHVRIDERSAGFLALGLARASGRPVAVACTSGTAAANLHPAVLEARHARVPLIVITTDRKPVWRGTGANQTTDQVRMFGTSTGFFAELESVPGDEATAGYWRSVLSRTVAAAAGGPVQLNLMLPDPLENTADAGAGQAGVANREPRPRIRVVRSLPEPQALEVPARGVVVVGDAAADPAGAVAFAEQAGWPLLAEPQSGARQGGNAITTYGYLLSHPGFRAVAHPEAVVAVGRAGVNLALLNYLGSVKELIVVDPAEDWADPARTATKVISRLGKPVQERTDPDWLRLWLDADKAALEALDSTLDAGGVTEPRIARDLAAALPPGSLLFAASSMPVRDVERTLRPRGDLRILANRGLSGIDGAVSSAIGAALAHEAETSGRAYALLGDLSLLHDQNGLITGAAPARPDLVIVVVNNNGGGIFSMTPQSEPIDGFETFFGTPHNVRLDAVARAADWPYTRAGSMTELLDAVRAPGPRLVEVVTDRRGNAEFHRFLAGAVGQAISESLTGPAPEAE
ncbi:2-succinyl-5-enolpyruvyl-6-hydroxy-3-cyclohexene-1-carboxylic-acid synthase [Streptomyces sp. RKAG337]|uniref:2-succinyl-5-enolpyruvyl-6-hydroxy-3- cyclohexene-1-carboxylic-acid synthase n=1 Tax=Streptomyces sp. RKAG337 TaxID=2893404 RepID=UPI002033D971|nr:2-succinyl-5-enolpyruvyl-6-hydroxy-3-cyclohexene-1-carboxylic-acid synthase [Streptomyces sp. RKAG337]MCM2430010.1 2-succinyl-5-enolpyruvyl-6-hydroxy-3-cyclohexene-1-carboxylic-acid synthase [Streptomyces sp. RKAG337]